jgi:hypothetical protein
LGRDATVRPRDEFAKPSHFVAIGPDDPQVLGGRLSGVQPAAFDTAAQFADGHLQFASQVGQPPFVRRQGRQTVSFVRDALPTPYAPKSNPADGIWRYVKYRPELLKSFIRFTKLPINL